MKHAVIPRTCASSAPAAAAAAARCRQPAAATAARLPTATAAGGWRATHTDAWRGVVGGAEERVMVRHRRNSGVREHDARQLIGDGLWSTRAARTMTLRQRRGGG